MRKLIRKKIMMMMMMMMLLLLFWLLLVCRLIVTKVLLMILWWAEEVTAADSCPPYTTKDRWGHFNFIHSRFHLHEFTTSTLRIPLRWIHDFNLTISALWTSRFQLYEFKILSLRSWNRDFVKLKSWIHEVEILTSWSWNPEFCMLKSWIHEVAIVNS
jgi:hypothetical protein